MASGGAARHCVRIVRGSIYLDRELYELYLARSTSLAALWREGQAWLLPLQSDSAGGLILKIRNLQGDRVVHAPEFLGSAGFDADAAARDVPVRWVSAMAGLLLEIGPQAGRG
jgi:hypothetical protein